VIADVAAVALEAVLVKVGKADGAHVRHVARVGMAFAFRARTRLHHTAPVLHDHPTLVEHLGSPLVNVAIVPVVPDGRANGQLCLDLAQNVREQLHVLKEAGTAELFRNSVAQLVQDQGVAPEVDIGERRVEIAHAVQNVHLDIQLGANARAQIRRQRGPQSERQNGHVVLPRDPDGVVDVGPVPVHHVKLLVLGEKVVDGQDRVLPNEAVDVTCNFEAATVLRKEDHVAFHVKVLV